VLNDTLSTTYSDLDHSGPSEHRFLTVGMSEQNRILVVAHAEHGNAIRIITARQATRKERKFYEEG